MSNVQKTTKVSWLDRIIAKTKASEEEKLEAFQKYALKVYTRNLNIHKDNVKKLEEKVSDIKEKASEVFEELDEDLISASLSVDEKKISTRDQRECTFDTFDKGLSNALYKRDMHVINVNGEIEEIEKQIKIEKDTVDKFQAKINLLK